HEHEDDGVPVAATASSSCCCTPGKPSDARLAASPLMSPRSPRTSTATFACRAAATAAANPAVAVSSMPAPCAYTTCVPAGTFALMPCSTVTTSSARPCVCHGPSGSSLLSASGPMTAMVLDFERGNVGAQHAAPLPTGSFFNNTI